MKEICAIIRINRINETKQALAAAGFAAITARKALGRGKGGVEYLIQAPGTSQLKAAEASSEKGSKLVPKRLLTLIVPDGRKDAAVQAIMQANQTGKPGDGRIFVMPVLDAYRVRTEEQGDVAIDEQG